MHGEQKSWIEWDQVWQGVVARLEAHCSAGRKHLLTEDTLRMSTIESLGAEGVDPARIATEVNAPGLGAGKLDLTVDGLAGAVVEFKFPRDSRTGISPDTMTLGELLRDFCRVAMVDCREGWVVQLLNVRLARYLEDAARRFQLEWGTQLEARLHLTDHGLTGLPPTALKALGLTAWRLPVTGDCVYRAGVAEDLTLLVYSVASSPADGATQVHLVPEDSAGPRPRARATRAPSSRGVPTGARAAILEAVDALTRRSGRESVSVSEVLNHLRQQGSPYADSTIRTMMTAHMCADAHGVGIGNFDDLERVSRGEYRRLI